MFVQHQAFIWNGKEKSLKIVNRLPRYDIKELFGIDKQKELLLSNTKAFIEGKKVNNVLLWGERGTGKTTLIRSLLGYFKKSSLRMIQVLKNDIITMPYLYDIIYEHRDLRFIIFIDDLSFNENEQEFRDLKIVMDGGIEEIPENSVIYATSNRRNLMPAVSQSDNELFPEDSLQERASLIERFGLRIGFYRFSQEQYLDIVKHYATSAGIDLNPEELTKRAREWALIHGTTGRSAYQFVLSLQIF
ncbi:ATP-binding protein [Thermodesulfovibrio yellowstonii]|uniref:ATP-binding protein n=1 Tax=Thermodesulfovibrio yellowstonii TaxID=28262 RepID=UPI0024B33A22|nr:ATP-binding protein [Thermodesulfovibrio yellowstonii]MDI6864746.1 ATP-binding protein [Thermodesulfovibrio yellowstonii]